MARAVPVGPRSNAKVEQRERSHENILANAARLLRERGLSGASVDVVMGAAGLTRGGFYAHFRDKTAMAVAGIDRAFAEARGNLLGAGLPPRGPAWVEAAAKRYLSEAHLDHPGRGCAVPALAGEVARGEPEVREAFGRGVGEMLDGIERRLDGGDRRARAIVLLATCVGGMAIARAVSSRGLAREVLGACRRSAATV